LGTGDVEVTLVNQSPKSIYAYILITSDAPVRKAMTVFQTVEPWEPGQTKTERIPANNLKSDSLAKPDSENEIVFSAFCAEGRICEGNEQDSQKLKQTLTGMKEQAARVLGILRDASVSSQKDSARVLESVQAQVASTSTNEESQPQSKEHVKGKAMVNQEVLRMVSKLRTQVGTPGFDLKVQIVAMISYYERLTERL